MNRKTRAFRLAPMAAALALAFGSSAHAVTATWAVNADGNWNTVSNWSAALPLAGDDVIISRGVAVTVTYSTGTLSINSLLLGAANQTLNVSGGTLNTNTLNNLGTVIVTGGNFGVNSGNSGVIGLSNGNLNLIGTLTLTGTVRLQGGTLAGGTVQQSGGNRLLVTSFTSTLDGTTVRGTLDVGSATNPSARVRISNGLTVLTEAGASPGIVNVGTVAGATGVILGFTGTQTFNNATINIGNATQNSLVSLDGTGTFTLGSGAIVQGRGSFGPAQFLSGTMNLANNGTISANQAGGTLNVSPSGTLTNTGILEARNGGILTVAPGANWSNAGGTLRVVDATSVLNLGGTITALGTLDNAAGGNLRLNGGTILGATVQLSAPNGLLFSGSGGVLDGVTWRGVMNVGDALNPSGRVRISNGLTVVTEAGASPGVVNVGTVAGASGAFLGFTGTQTFSNATINIGNATQNSLVSLDGTGTFTLASSATVQGRGSFGPAQFVGGTMDLANNGTFSANQVGGTLNVSASGTLTNTATGILEARGGGILTIGGAWTNAGTIRVVDAASAVNMGGTFTTTAMGVFDNAAGGTLNLTGTLTNTGSTLTFSPATGSMRLLDGTVTGGTIQQSGANRLVFTSSTGFLDGVTHRGTMTVGDAVNTSGRVRINTGLTVLTEAGASPGVVNVGTAAGAGNALLGFNTTQTFDNATINLGSATNASANISQEGAGTLTLGANAIVQGRGIFGQAQFVGGTANLVNNGTIRANINGGTLTINNSGTLTNNGTFEATGGGVLTVSPTGSFTNLAGNTLTGGTYNVIGASTLRLSTPGGVSITTNAATILLDGATSALLNSTNGNAIAPLATNTAAGSFTIRNGRNFTTVGAFNNSGTVGVGAASTFATTGAFTNAATATLQLNGGTFNATTLSNAGNITGFGTVNQIVNTNTGTITATGGTLAMRQIVGGSGTVQINAGATLDLSLAAAASSADFLIQNGTLNLGANNFTVLVDYTNANFGVGNAFNPRANVTGAGQINAGGTVQQTITGARVSGGTTATPVLDFGNVRVGVASDATFTINNVGAGAALRGAIQTTGITAPTLSGTGVTAQNFGAIASGQSTSPYTVTFSASQVGSLSGQTIGIVNNFANVADQMLALAGAAYNPAAGGAVTPNPVLVANQRVGGSAQVALTITNTAPVDNLFTERLNVSFGANTGTAINNAGAITGGTVGGLAGGASTSAAMSAGVDTSAPGARSGTVTLNFLSNGTGTSGLLPLDLPSQVVNVSGNVYRVAQPALPASVNLGNFRAVSGVAAQPFTITNTSNAPAGFQEALNTSAGTTTGGVTLAGVISLLAQGASSNAMSVGFAAGGATGDRAGTATVNLVSDGQGTSGLGQLGLSSQVVNVTGTAYALAQPSVPTGPLNLGNFRAGAAPTQSINITNTLVATGFQEGLDVAAGALAGTATISGAPVTNLAAGASSNAILLGLSSLAAGSNTGTVTLNLASNGTGTSGLSALALASSAPITINATGWNLAQAGAITPSPVVLANQRIGGGLTQALTVSNVAPVSGFTEGLNASFGTNSGNALNNGGTVALLAGGASNNSSLVVRVDTTTAGARSGTATVNLVSDGTASTLGNTNLASQVINVSGNVYQVAQPTVSTTSVNLGNFRAGTPQSQSISISNPLLNATAAFQEGLNATAGATTGQATTSGGPIVNLGAGVAGSSAISVGVTGVAGVNSGTAAITFASNGTGTSGLGTLALPAQTASINVTGTGYRLAQAGSVGPINFGNVLRNSAQERFVTISNTAIADGFSEGLNASFGAFGGGSAALLSGVGSISNLGAGSNNAAAMRVVLDTANVGQLAANTTATLNFVSNGTLSGLSNTNLSGQTIAVSGEIVANIGDVAVASQATPNPVNFGSFRVGAPAPANVALSISNTGTGAGEGLNASIATASSGFSASGSFTSLARNGATNNSSLVVGFSATATAGAKSGTATITLASDGTFNNNVTTPLGTQVIGLNANVYQVAQPTLPTNVAFGNFRVGSAPAAQAVSIGNTLVAPAGFQEGLNASIGALTGAATASGGPIANLGAGNTSNAISVGISGIAGSNAGTVGVTLASNGTISGLLNLALTSGSIAVSGQGFVAAAGTLNTAALNFGTVQVGQSVSQVLSISNSASGLAGFVEDLAVAFGASTGTGASRISGTGSISGLLAGATNSTGMTVMVDTTSAGSVAGAIAVNYTSAGAVNGVSNGLGTLGVGSSSFGVTGTINANVVNTAAPVINTAQPINLGNLRQGSVAPTALVSITNQLTTAPQAALNASMSGNGNVTGSGSFNLLAPGLTNAVALQVGLANTNTAGFNTGNATIAFVSDASNIGNCAPNCQLNLPSQNVTVNANVYRLASPVVNTGPIVLAARVGGAASQAVSISNTSVDAFTEGLNVSRTGTAAGFTSAGSISNLPAQATNAAAITVALNTATAGTFGGNLGLGFVSTGAGTTGAADVAATTPSANVSLTGRVYTPAVASVAPAVAFGIVRVGDFVAQRGVSVANSAAVTALNDTLSASIGGTGGVFSNNGGSVNGLVAGGAANNTALTVGLNTASAGVFNGSATVAARSRNPDLADLTLGNSTVTLTGQVNNLAVAAFQKTSGAGAFAQTAANAFTLDFGDIAQGASGILTARLAAWNRALAGAPSDDLKGSFSGADNTLALSFSGFSAFGAGGTVLGANQTGPELLVNLFNTTSTGLFTQTIALTGFSFNASDLLGIGTNATLFVRANVFDPGGTSVVPLPPAGFLLLGGLAMMGWMGRRRSA